MAEKRVTKYGLGFPRNNTPTERKERKQVKHHILIVNSSFKPQLIY